MMNLSKILCVSALALSLAACELPSVSPVGKTVTIQVDLGRRTFRPVPTTYQPAGYLLEGTSLAGKRVGPVSSGTGSFTLANLAVDTWVFTLTALNSQGISVLAGSANVDLAAVSSAVVTLSPQGVVGQGLVQIASSWEISGVSKVAGFLTPTDFTTNSNLPIAVTLGFGAGRTASWTGTVPAGTYSLKLKLYDSAASPIVESDAQVVLVFNGQTSTGDPITYFHPTVMGAVVSPGWLRMLKGDRSVLSVTLTPAVNINSDVVWSSSDPEVASVDAWGAVTALAPGSAVITATPVDGLSSDSCAVSVLDFTFPRDELLGEWLFNGGSDDTSGAVNPAALAGDAAYGPDRFGRVSSALQFSGAGYATANQVNFQQGTLSVWVNPDFTGSSQFVLLSEISNTSGGNPGPFEVQLRPDLNMVYFAVGDHSVQTAAYNVPNHAWTHLAFTYGATGYRIYVNGILSAQAFSHGVLPNLSVPLTFGARSYDYNYPVTKWGLDKALIDDVRIYGRALNDTEVSGLFHEAGFIKTGVTPQAPVDPGLSITGLTFQPGAGGYYTCPGVVNAAALPANMGSYAWYLDGVLQAETGPAFSHAFPLADRTRHSLMVTTFQDGVPFSFTRSFINLGTP